VTDDSLVPTITTVQPLTVWELLSRHQSITPLLDGAPDTVVTSITGMVAALNQAFTDVERVALAAFDTVPRDVSRAEQDAFIDSLPHPDIVRSMLDGHNYAPAIWRLVQPATDQEHS
jgi:hypothetical protein